MANNLKKIKDSGSKIRFNIAMIHATSGEHEIAVDHFQAALKLDRYLAVAYFQHGVSKFLLQDFEEAKDSFNSALLYLRGNMLIDYAQLGLKFRLFSCEVLFNRGLCSILLGDAEEGLNDFSYASKEKQTGEHDVIDEAIRDEGEGYTVFSIPVGVLYRPDESKVRNLAARDYLGKAKLIATSDAGDTGTGFRAYEKKLQSMGLPLDLPPATVTGLQQTQPLPSLTTSMPMSAYVLPMSKDKRIDNDRNRIIPGLVQDLERKASVASVRSQFRAPTRPSTRTSADLPPTPPPSSGRVSRQASDASSVSMSDAPNRFLASRSKLTVKPLFKKETAISRSNSARPSVEPRSISESSYYEEEDHVDTSTKPSPRQVSKQSSMSSDTLSSPARELQEIEIYTQSLIPIPRKNAVSHESPSAQLNYYEDLVDDYFNNENDVEDERLTEPVLPTTVKKIKCKIYGLQDARIITIEPFMAIDEFRLRLCKKFGWMTLPKLRIKDDDDEMILLADQEDFDHVCEVSVSRARKEHQEIGRMEIFVKDESKRRV